VRVFVSLILIFFILRCEVTMNYKIKNRDERVRLYLDERVKSYDPVGLQYRVLQNGKMIFSHNAGYSDLKKKVSVKDDTMFFIYSTTKLVTAIGILHLIDKGFISLADSIHDHLIGLSFKEKITIRQLLNQTSGLANPLPLKWLHTLKEHNKFNSKVFMNKILQEENEIDFKPGKKYKYSNLAYYILGLLVEKVSKKSYISYIDENILKPLSIKSNEFSFIIQKEKQAIGYIKRFSFLNMVLSILSPSKLYKGHVNGQSYFHYLYNAAESFGGSYATANGLAKIVIGLVNNKPKLLSNKTKNLLFNQEVNNDGKEVKTTIALNIGEFNIKKNKITYFGRPGGGAGYFANLRFYPKYKIVTIILANQTKVTPSSIFSFSDAVDKEFLKGLASK